MIMLREIRLLFWRRVLETLRSPAWVISGLSTPLLYLALFTPLLENLSAPIFGANNVMEGFVPGILALMAFAGGMGAGWIVIFELQSGVIERFRVTPASRFSLLMATVLRDIVMFVIPAVLVILLSSLFDFPLHWGGIALLLVLLSMWTAIVSAFSGSLGLILKDIGGLAAIVTGIQLPLILLSGVLLPLSLAPDWMQVIAHFNPMYYAVEASRVLANGVIQDTQVWLAFIVMIPLTALVLWWSTTIYRKAVS